MDLLRQQTLDHHRALDENISLESITSSKSDYLQYLTNFCAGFLEANANLNWPLLEDTALPDLEIRQERYINLISNIMELNRSDQANPRLPSQGGDSLASLPQTVGTLYVLEGSVHGGRQIFKTIEERIPSLRPLETTFLKGFGTDSSKVWKRYCQWLNERSFSAQEREAACQSAISTFGIFQRHFGPPTPRP